MSENEIKLETLLDSIKGDLAEIDYMCQEWFSNRNYSDMSFIEIGKIAVYGLEKIEKLKELLREC